MVITSKMCMAKDVGMNGNLFGGNMLAWMDEAAAIFAHQITGEKRMVTKKFGEIVFVKPVKVGDIISFDCSHEQIGTSSIEFMIEADVNGTYVFFTNAVFVAVDENGVRKAIGRPVK